MKKLLVAIGFIAIAAAASVGPEVTQAQANVRFCKYDPDGVYYCCYWDGGKVICRKENPE